MPPELLATTGTAVTLSNTSRASAESLLSLAEAGLYVPGDRQTVAFLRGAAAETGVAQPSFSASLSFSEFVRRLDQRLASIPAGAEYILKLPRKDSALSNRLGKMQASARLSAQAPAPAEPGANVFSEDFESASFGSRWITNQVLGDPYYPAPSRDSAHGGSHSATLVRPESGASLDRSPSNPTLLMINDHSLIANASAATLTVYLSLAEARDGDVAAFIAQDLANPDNTYQYEYSGTLSSWFRVQLDLRHWGPYDMTTYSGVAIAAGFFSDSTVPGGFGARIDDVSIDLGPGPDVQLSVTNSENGEATVTSSPGGTGGGSTSSPIHPSGANAAAIVPEPGKWVGTNIQFNVAPAGDTITQTGSSVLGGGALYLKFTSFPYCVVSVELYVRSDIAITNGAFSYSNSYMSVSGQFTSSTTASGTASYSEYVSACGATMSSNLSWTASKSVSYSLSVTKAGDGGGTVTSSPAGITCGSTCSAAFDSGTAVTLSAAPDSSSIFSGWSGACSGTGSCSVSMTQARSVTATFTAKPPGFSLFVTKAGDGGGTVTSSPAGINCGSTCSASFGVDTTVTLSATPNSTSIFSGWSGACSGTGSCSVSMTQTRSVTATFTAKPPTYSLSVTKAGDGGGTVTSSPAGINCGSACSATYDLGTVVTLSATPNSNSNFWGWSGACAGTGSCSVSMTQARSVTATFTAKPPTFSLSVTKAGDGEGTVTSSPAGINCGSACSAAYDSGIAVILSATPDSNSNFWGWSGACTGTGSCSISMTQARSVSASFTKKTTSASELLLQLNRVAVTLTWRNQYDPSGNTKGNGTAVKQMDQYGYFFFDSPENPEVFVKVLDFGGNSFLVFHSALSDLEYTLHYRVLRTGITYTFRRDAGSICGLVDVSTVAK
jgi:hypothetical protein